MAQTKALIKTLKLALRASRFTYSDIARHLGMSEANVKRLFATESFTLHRLESVCELLQLELGDLFLLYEESRAKIRHLTLQQEQELVSDTGQLLVAVSVRNRLSYNDIISRYTITEPEAIRYLARLDRLGIIDLLPGNRIKLLIDEQFNWLPNGPIERFYQQQVQAQFLKSRFKSEIDLRLFQFGLLGESSCRVFIKKLQALAQEFMELHHQDLNLPLEQRYNMGLLVALRPWELEIFKPLMRRLDT